MGHMRVGMMVRGALALAVVASGAQLWGQFTEPTKEELQMTEDPKAPGAAAVYLYREETADDDLNFEGLYERIKILKEKGKDLATIRIPYERGGFRVTDIRGRTIHADGTVIPLKTKPEDLTDFKTRTMQRNTVVFTLPSVEVGSILEYRLNLRYDDSMVIPPTWEVQQPYFVHKAHYFFKPFSKAGHTVTDSDGDTLSQLMYAPRLGSGDAKVVESHQGTFTLDVTDVPAIPDDDWMPPLNVFKWKVEFYYTKYHSGTEYWQAQGKRWAKRADEFTNPGPLHQAVEGIVAPGDTDEVKAHKIYAAVMKLENTSYTRQKSEAERKKEKIKEIHNAEDVWKQQSGYDDQIALLFIALARAANLKVYPIEVVDRSKAVFDPQFMSMGQLNDYMAAVVIDGKTVYLDPGQKYCPYGQLTWRHAMASGIQTTDKGPMGVTTPGIAYKMAVEDRVANLTIGSDGSVTGTLRFIFTGPQALYWRQRVLESDESEVKKEFNESMRRYIPEGVEADFDHFIGLSEYEANLIGTIKVTGSMGTTTGKHAFVPGLFFESRAKHPFVAQEKRDVPVDVHYPLTEIEEVHYTLPEGYKVESLPQESNLNWPNHALMRIHATSEGNTVTVHRTLIYNYTLLDSKEYSSLRDFYQKVATADQQQLVLTRAGAAAAPAKGN